MSSNNASLVDNVPANASPTATVDRVITGLTVWWLTFPVALFVGVGIFSEPSRHIFWEGVGRILLWAGLGGATVAPAAGTMVALIGRRRRACWRFAIMGAASVSGCVLVRLLPS